MAPRPLGLRGRNLAPELVIVQPRVEPIQRQQLGVGAALDDAAVIEHQDLVRIDDGRQTVRDHERRAPLRDALQHIAARRGEVWITRAGAIFDAAALLPAGPVP